MTLLTGETDVFSSATSTGRCVVMFMAKNQLELDDDVTDERERMTRLLTELAAEGWVLSIRRMFDPAADPGPFVLDTGFANATDFAGVFEAPSLSAALLGTVRLEQAGWARCFATEWLIGPREFATVNGLGPAVDRPWAFLALWEWNDAWSAASPAERVEYDLECDVAFKGDLGFNINIAGRHRLDWAHGWHHLGIWESPSVEAIDQAITGHEDAADFMFTTSRHVIGRIVPFTAILQTGETRS